jgi:predicted amidohydrolase
MLKIGVAQIKNSGNIEENFNTIQNALCLFEKTEVDLVLFPECSLSGFTGKLNCCTIDGLSSYLSKVEAWSLKNKKHVFLPSAIIEDDKVFNSGFFFGEEQAQNFFKQGLTDSEKTFFSLPSVESKKVFEVKGYKLALIICFEAEQATYEYFNKGEADIILWPGYWGWEEGETWGELKKNGETNKIFQNMKEWNIPLIQSNFSFNDLSDHRGTGPHGLSMFVNSNNTLYSKADPDSESCYEIHVADNEIKFSQKIGDL